MIFRQLFDAVSSTYTYLIGSHRGGGAILIDPVLERTDQYLKLLDELGLRLLKAADTHLHADHITALGALRDKTRCVTVMGEQSSADTVSVRVADGDVIDVDGISLTALYTPGHTDDSYCYLMQDRVFTGDTLLIRGTGRTDFQNGDAGQAYDSLVGKLLTLPDAMFVYPGHDYNGNTVSTIGEEKACNPRLQVKDRAGYIALMNSLHLAEPKKMSVAVPANQRIGLSQQRLEQEGRAISPQALMQMSESERRSVLLVDLRDSQERTRHGIIADSLCLPYPELSASLARDGLLAALQRDTGRQIVFYCAFGERSAMAVRIAEEAGILGVRHLSGGIAAWHQAGGKLVAADQAGAR